jgi:predicted ribosome quality control (RQC) complex YloA/Tae2 family protein
MNQEWEQQVRVPWAEIGQWLKTHQSLDVSQVWMGYIDMNLSLSENIENCFTQVREYQRRENGVEKRRRVLSEEILQLTEQLQQPVTPQDIKKAEKIPWEPAAQLRTYRIELGEGLQVYRGRSAKDNLGLLRKAPPWTLWLHLRDYPGSYGFIRRDKQQAVKDNLIYEAAKWLVKETVGKKIGMGRFAVVCTECRYVRPIKGDRQGRVQIQKERVFNVEI